MFRHRPSADFGKVPSSAFTALPASDPQLRAVFSQAAIGIAVADLDARFLAANEKFCRILGYSEEELLQKDFMVITHPEDAEKTRTLVEELLAGDIPNYSTEKRYLRKDGSTVWSNTTVTLLRREDAPAQFIGIIEDITERRLASEIKSRLAAVVESSDDAIITKTLDSIITTWNPSAERMFGYRAEEVIGKSVTILIPENHLDEEPDILRRLRRGERIHHYETVRRRKDGTLIDVSISVSPVKDGSGHTIGASKIARDITQRKRDEAQLRDADQRKDEFLATLAHELRNPLAPIRQAAALAGSASTTEEQKRWAHAVIGRQVQHMSLLLDDLLDISRITRGALELRPRTTSLGEIADAAVETARPSIESRGHRFQVELAGAAEQFSADPLRMAQIVANLLTNAAKYTENGGDIGLRGEVSPDVVTFTVRDTGMGIAPETLPNLFTMFAQVATSRGRADGGLGIGLALAKGLAQLHGGSIEARSPGVNQGSEFVVRIPRRAEQVKEADNVSPEGATVNTRRRVLIADDNEDAARSLAMLLEITGHEVTVAHDGEQALERFDSHHPEFVLLDIGMPRLDGYEVARRLRQRPGGDRVTLIALTGWGQASDKAKATAAGFNIHYTKPVDPQQIIDLLAKA